jgi:hypothetical protein
VLLIIDELGKFLEYSARAPEQGDIHVLQLLAETTSRFSPPGLYVFTILHQAFDRYAAGLRPATRDEWAKVQGRFEDIAFQEPPDQFLDLIGRAINHAPHPLASSLERRARRQAETAFDLGLAPRGMPKSQFIQALVRSAPLHPAAVLVLSRLCRKLAQHQRSLFAFLVSRDAHGFLSFLEREIRQDDLSFLRVCDLYDYVLQSIGSGLSIGESATRWAEVESALDRSLDSPREETEIVKTVGMLAAVGTYGEVKASRQVIEFALGLDKQPVERGIKSLLGRSILVYRKHNQAFALWQGSDVDIDAQVSEARKRIPAHASLAKKLAGLWTASPLVAKRHSFRTGTLRYFAVRFADVAEFPKATEPHGDADGLLIYSIPASAAEAEQLAELATKSPVRDRPEILVAVPRETTALW